MNRQAVVSALGDAQEEQRAAAVRLCESALFRRSPRLREMLSYIVECGLGHRVEDLTELRIAENVFGRRDYNSSEDNIVRVSARQLRSKIAEYYAGEGQSDAFRLDVPKGGYLPVFHRREEASNRTELEILRNPGVGSLRRWPASPAQIAAAFSVLLLIAALSALLLQSWKENRELRASLTSSLPRTLFEPFVADPKQRINIVVTDSALGLYEALSHSYVSLEDYTDYQYQSAPGIMAVVRQGGSNFMDLLRTRQICSLADFRVTSLIFQTYPQQARRITVHHARNMHARDFDSDDNFVVMGSLRSNPWGSLFNASLNFRLSSRYGSHCFENRQPRPEEQPLYCSDSDAAEQGTDYAQIVVTRNGNRKGRFLLIGGLDMEATEAAGDFFLNSESVSPVLAALHVRNVNDLQGYELLLRNYSVGGTGRSAQLVAARQLP